MTGGPSYTGYLYDGEGSRIASGTLTSLSCNFATNGFSLTKSWVRNAGNQEGEWNGSGVWQHTNIYDGSSLMATYSAQGSDTYFALNDWLGTKRAEVSPDGCFSTFESLPYGDDLTSSGDCPDATEQHYTGKERDTESGNDYFGARYYASSMGNFMSADPMMASAKIWDPQTWSRYAYARNNPLIMIDPTGEAEVTAGQCAQDKRCVTVNVNVIYDKNANGGKGLTDAQKSAFEKNQLQTAKDQFGNADIHLNVTYSAGGVSTHDGQMYASGLKSDALNVVVTDQVGTAGSFMAGKTAISLINANSTDKSDLPTEMSHHFMGDTRGVLNWITGYDPTGISRGVSDALFDSLNDSERAWMNHLDQHSGPMSHYPLASAFHHNAEVFQRYITPTTKPQ